MEPEEHRHNPNVCPSCERLLEDESPMLMADMTRIMLGQENETPFVDRPTNSPDTQSKTGAPRSASKRSAK